MQSMFSIIKVNKNKIINKLATEILSGLLQTKNLLKKQNKSSFDFTTNGAVMAKQSNYIQTENGFE